MGGPLFYILAPFGLAIALFAVHCLISLLLRDPARPFRMFAAGPILNPAEEAKRLLDEMEGQAAPPAGEDHRLEALRRLRAGRKGPEWDGIGRRAEALERLARGSGRRAASRPADGSSDDP